MNWSPERKRFRFTRTPALPPYLQHTLAGRRGAIAAFLADSQQGPE
jgi:hypothetical protein